MKKLLFGLTLVLASLGWAQESSNRSALGLYLLGLQYTADLGGPELRFGAGLPLFALGGGGGALLSGSVDVLFPMGLVGSNTRWYLGGGSEVYVILGGSGGGAVLTPRGFANFEFAGDGASFFLEGGLQGVIAVGGGSVFGASVLIPHFRLGVNFR